MPQGSSNVLLQRAQTSKRSGTHYDTDVALRLGPISHCEGEEALKHDVDMSLPPKKRVFLAWTSALLDCESTSRAAKHSSGLNSGWLGPALLHKLARAAATGSWRLVTRSFAVRQRTGRAPSAMISSLSPVLTDSAARQCKITPRRSWSGLRCADKLTKPGSAPFSAT